MWITPRCRGGALEDSSHWTSHCFPRRVLPRKGLPSAALICLCQAWSLSHIRHTSDRQPGAYHTLNKRGHIPCVFPHEDTSCSRGSLGHGESTGDWLRTTHPLPIGSYQLCFLSTPSSPSLHPSIHLHLPLCSSSSRWSDLKALV